MKKKEHELFRERMRALASKVLLEWLARNLRDELARQPATERLQALMAVRYRLDQARLDYSLLALPNEAPEMSDMKTAEFQEAFDEISKKVEAILAQPGGRYDK